MPPAQYKLRAALEAICELWYPGPDIDGGEFQDTLVRHGVFVEYLGGPVPGPLRALPEDIFGEESGAPEGEERVFLRDQPAIEEAASLRARLRALLEDGGELERLREENAQLREDRRSLFRERNGEVWLWQSDGENELESLGCPILISADQMRELLKDGGEREAFVAGVEWWEYLSFSEQPLEQRARDRARTEASRRYPERPPQEPSE